MYHDQEDARVCLVDEGTVKQEQTPFYTESETTKRIRPHRSWSRVLLWILVGHFAVWGFLDLSMKAYHWSKTSLNTTTPHCWCGNTDEEAIAMGCHYDHLAVDWLPESCIDSELTREFDRAGSQPDGSWPYYKLVEPVDDSKPSYLKQSHQQSDYVPINETEIDSYAQHGMQYYTTRRWHILHCMYTWRKQLRLGYDVRYIEPWNMKEEHVEHCSDYIMQTFKGGWKIDDIETLILGVDRHKGE